LRFTAKGAKVAKEFLLESRAKRGSPIVARIGRTRIAGQEKRNKEFGVS
jgi:hypothetical protein